MTDERIVRRIVAASEDDRELSVLVGLGPTSQLDQDESSNAQCWVRSAVLCFTDTDTN